MPERFEELKPKERRGSRARCVIFTDGHKSDVARRLTELVSPHAVVHPDRHVWQPRGTWPVEVLHAHQARARENRDKVGLARDC